MSVDRVVQGLTCSDVLALLSDYLDQELCSADRERVEGHLRGCEGCARFGGAFSATVRALKLHLAGPLGAPARVKERLREALRAEADREGHD